MKKLIIMIYQEYFDKLIHKMADEAFGEKLKAARLEYIKAAGEVFEDDKSFDIRMDSFLEWYLLDYHLIEGGYNGSPLSIYLSKHGEYINAEDRDFLNGLADNLHSIFEVKRHESKSINLEDIFTAEKYLVKEDNRHCSFRRGDILEARLFLFKGSYFFTNTFCFHPKSAYKFISEELKKMRKNGNKNIKDFILRASYMNLMYERARQIDINNIYR
jgi:hypothetical protein